MGKTKLTEEEKRLRKAEQNKKYRQSHAERIIQHKREWRRQHREEINEKERVRMISLSGIPKSRFIHRLENGFY